MQLRERCASFEHTARSAVADVTAAAQLAADLQRALVECTAALEHERRQLALLVSVCHRIRDAVGVSHAHARQLAAGRAESPASASASPQQRFSFSPSSARASSGGELVALSSETLAMSAVTDVIDTVAELMSVRHEVRGLTWRG